MLANKMWNYFFLIFSLNLLKYYLAEEQGNWKISLKSNP